MSAIANCHHCRKELYDGDECLTRNQQDYWCMDCYDDFVRFYKEEITDDHAVKLYDYGTLEIGF